MTEFAGDAFVASPCVNVCQLDRAADLCLGCFRTRAEIAAWSGLSADDRRRVLALSADRRTASERNGR